MLKNKYFKNNIAFNLFLIILLISTLLASVFTGCKNGTEKTKDDLLVSSTEKSEASSEQIEDSGKSSGEEITDEAKEPEVDEYGMVDKRIEEFINALDIGQGDFIELTYEDKEYLIDTAYRAVSDYLAGITQVDESLFLEKYNNIENEIFTVFRIGGEKKGSSFAKKDNLEESVYAAAWRTIEDAVNNESITENDSGDLKIEVVILGDEKLLDENYERGIHGLRLAKNSSSATYINTIALEENYSLFTMLNKICQENGLSEDCYDNEEVKIYYFPAIHFASTGFSDEITTFYRCNIIEKRPEFNLEKIKKSLDMAQGWMLLNLNEDGYFNYEYSPSNGEYSSTNNMIRQLMSSRWLAEVSGKNKDLIQMHKVNLDYVLRNWYREDEELGYIYFDKKSKIGAMAMALRTLAYSPYLEEYKDKAQKLANNILFLQDEDGSLNAWYIEPEYTYDEEMLLRFYSGETILALVDFYEATGEKQYLDAAIKSQEYYLDKYINNMEEDEDYYPAFIPWHSQSLNKLYKITGDTKYSDAIFKITDEVIKIQNQDGRPYIDFLGRFYSPDHPEYGAPHSASTAVYLEGVAYAYEIALIGENFEKIYEYRKSIILGVHNLMNLQFKGADMYYLENPQRVEGAIRVGVDNSRIRIDTTQHTIDAFRKVLEVFELD